MTMPGTLLLCSSVRDVSTDRTAWKWMSFGRICQLAPETSSGTSWVKQVRWLKAGFRHARRVDEVEGSRYERARSSRMVTSSHRLTRAVPSQLLRGIT